MISHKPEALIFDVFGTLVDWRSGVAAACRKHFDTKGLDTDPLEFADLWRAEYQPAMERIRSGGRGYVALELLHRENLDRLLAATGLASAFNDSERDALNLAWENLPPWPDTITGLQALRETTLLAPCSNGSIGMMARLARNAGFTWDAILGASIARNYKPEAEVYTESCKALALEPEQVMMVAAHNDDLTAARDAGLMTAFIPRPLEHGAAQKNDLEATSRWDIIAADLPDLAEKLAFSASQKD